MTYKNGFIGGFALGALLWLPESGTVQSSGNVTMFAVYLLAAFGIDSLIIGVVSAFRQRSAINTTVDGMIFGVTTSFGLL